MAKEISGDGRPLNINHFPEHAPVEKISGNDLLTQILVRLPAKTLIRFKLVSKQWSSLISDPQFGRTHTCRTNPNSFVPSCLYFYNPFTDSQEIESISLDNGGPNVSPSGVRVRVRVPSLSFIDSASAGAPIDIVQSCNGLLLCRFTFQSVGGSQSRNYCVCNPTTKKYTMLPQCDVSKATTLGVNLAFDPSKSPHYKAVCVRLWRSCVGGPPTSMFGTLDFGIFSSETGSWRSVGCHDISKPLNMVCEEGVFWKGRIHWFIDDRKFLLYFDVEAEILRAMPMPSMPGSSRNERVRYFGECRDHLHFIEVNGPYDMQFDVFEMEGDYSGWFVKYRVDIHDIISVFPEIVRVTCHKGVADYWWTPYAFSFLYLVEGEKEEDSELVLAIPGKVISYNFEHKTLKVLRDLPDVGGEMWILQLLLLEWRNEKEKWMHGTTLIHIIGEIWDSGGIMS